MERKSTRLGDFDRVVPRENEIAAYVKANGRQPAVYRMECVSCGKRVWGSGTGIGSHRRACHGKPKPKRDLDRRPTVDEIMAYEAGEMTDPQDERDFFQRLINTGMAWTLQGSYGRAAAAMIEAGLCTPAGATKRCGYRVDVIPNGLSVECANPAPCKDHPAVKR
jgi:hypothetical protein